MTATLGEFNRSTRRGVSVGVVGGGPAEARQENYVIERVLNPGVGDRVCGTGGNSARTDCSIVEALYTSAGGTAGLFRMENCLGGGDSGGPYFAAHVAYGIHSASVSGCGDSWAEQAPEAEDQMNVNIITA